MASGVHDRGASKLNDRRAGASGVQGLATSPATAWSVIRGAVAPPRASSEQRHAKALFFDARRNPAPAPRTAVTWA